MLTLKTIDAHTAGAPLRLVTEGYPAPRGRTMFEKSAWLERHADHLRRALIHEPRGHADMSGAVLTEPVAPGSHAGLLFMNGSGYPTMCGHAVMAVTTIALERGLLVPGGDGRRIVYDTPAGPVHAKATIAQSPARVERVVVANVPSFVVHAGLAIAAGRRPIRADIAFAGAFYAIVDSEGAGLAIDATRLPALRGAGVEIKQAIEAAQRISHPIDSRLEGIHGVIFTGPPHSGDADLCSVTILGDGQADRSPCATGTSALMAVLDAMGLLGGGQFVHEGLIASRFTGRVAGHTAVGDYPGILPEVAGSSWITGEHTFFVDDADPLGGGFRV